MAVKIATANGNLTTAATWATVDSTSFLDSEAANTVLTTAYVESAAFTPGAITIDGIAVKVATRVGSTGTITVRIANAGADVAGTVCTINVSDIDSRDGEQGWYFFKFAAPVVLLGATPYTLSAKTSSATQVNLFRNATAGNWSRMLRTTTTGAPAAGDSMHILGEWTAAATVTTRTVTMDQTAATDYGDGTAANPPGFTIGKNGVLTWGTTAATAYVLQLSTRMFIYRGGVMNQGTTGTPCPRDSSMTLQFDCVADGDFGIQNYGTRNHQGQSRTSGKLVVQCLATANVAGAATTATVAVDTGWLNADDIAIAPTARTITQGETRILSGAAGAALLTVTSGFTNAHSGTSPTQAEIILLTRNVKVRSVSTSAMSYIYDGPAAIVDADWTEFRYLGSATTGKRGIETDLTSLGSIAYSFCSIRDFEVGGWWFSDPAADNFALNDCVAWNCAQDNAGIALFINSQVNAATNWSLSNITIINCGATNGFGISTRSMLGAVSGIRVSGASAAGVQVEGVSSIYTRTRALAAWTTFELHTNTVGLQVQYIDDATIAALNCWRNVSFGISFLTAAYLTINTASIFGNGNGITFNGGTTGYKHLRLRTATVAGDSSFAQAVGIQLIPGGTTPVTVELDNCTFGVVSGINVAHSTADVEVNTGFKVGWFILRNTNLASATAINNQANLRPTSFIKYERVNQVTNVHKTVTPKGTIQYDAVTIHGTTPSQSLTPTSASIKLETGPMRANIASAATVAVSVYVRKSAAYNGNAPRLMQRANPAIGVLVDTVLATFSAAADTWQQLSATTAAATEKGVCEFYVDCDGTAGLAYVGDWVAV